VIPIFHVARRACTETQKLDTLFTEKSGSWIGVGILKRALLHSVNGRTDVDLVAHLIVGFGVYE
jgi:hypothetical protein